MAKSCHNASTEVISAQPPPIAIRRTYLPALALNFLHKFQRRSAAFHPLQTRIRHDKFERFRG
jgi:hypothetical protein